MEDGLVLDAETRNVLELFVLILVVMEDGLVHGNGCNQRCKNCCLNPCCNGRWSRTAAPAEKPVENKCLNPCCNGRWSRTRPYKTILIISKLKNFAKQILTFLNRKLTIP